MNPTIRVDRSVFDKKMLAMRKARPRALADGVATIGAEIATQAARISKRDTNRFARSIEMAQNDLARISGTVTPIGVSPVQVSSRELEYLDRIKRQAIKAEESIEIIDKLVKRNERKANFNESWPSHQRLLVAQKRVKRRANRAKKTYLDAKEAVEKNIPFQLMGGRANTGTIDKQQLLSTLSRVILKVYGGQGLVQSIGDKAFAIIKIKEPHGRIVEKRDGVLRASTAAARGAGIRRASFRYLKTLQASTTAVRG